MGPGILIGIFQTKPVDICVEGLESFAEHDGQVRPVRSEERCEFIFVEVRVEEDLVLLEDAADLGFELVEHFGREGAGRSGRVFGNERRACNHRFGWSVVKACVQGIVEATVQANAQATVGSCAFF